MAVGQHTSESLLKNAFFTYFYQDINSRYNQLKQEYETIEYHVNDLVKQLLKLIEKDDPYFRVLRVEPTGSYFEGTKVRQPDEFDYMVVLDYSVFAERVSVDSKCKSSPWFKRLVVESSKMTSETTKANIVASGNVVKPPDLSESFFWLKLKDVIEKDPISTRTITGVLRTNRVKHSKLYLEFTKSLSLPERKNDPSRTELVPINSMEVGVDLMLAFNHPDALEVCKNEGFPDEYKELLQIFGCTLVAKSCHVALNHQYNGKYLCDCWFISFASMETEMMKRLDEDHKKCYKVLKALLIGDAHYPGKCMNLSSYMLKTAMLFHVFGIDGCKKMSYHFCIPNIMGYLENAFRNAKMPCFFARDLNVWGRVVVAPVMAKAFDPEQEERRIHSMLWMEFWRRVILLVEKTLQKAYKEQDDWISVPLDLGNIRALISFILDEYLRSKQARSMILAGVQVMCGPEHDVFVPINTITDQARRLFPRYIQEWKTIVDCKRFSLDCLVDIDPLDNKY